MPTQYRIFGNTYPAREELVYWGCVWFGVGRYWQTNSMAPDDMDYKAIQRICRQYGLDIVAVEKLADDAEIDGWLADIRESI